MNLYLPFTGPEGKNEEKIYHSYYQWVPFILTFQALLFYTPHWIWKQLDGSHLEKSIQGLEKWISENNLQDETFYLDLAKHLKYLIKDRSLMNRNWAVKFFACEILNSLNVIAQIFLIDSFLDGEFLKYGTSVIKYHFMDEQEKRIDPMTKVFPLMTKCTFNKYGASGTIQNLDALCVLPINVLNEKIYIFLWFWLVFLATITGVHLLFKLFTYLVPSFYDR